MGAVVSDLGRVGPGMVFVPRKVPVCNVPRLGLGGLLSYKTKKNMRMNYTTDDKFIELEGEGLIEGGSEPL